MSELLKKLEETSAYIRSQYDQPLAAGIILGSGLGNLTSELKVQKEIPYNEIPHFPVSTVAGHKGKMIFAELGGKNVLVMSGRFHYYEGYEPQLITYPVRVMKQLGVEALFLSNAAGGVNPAFNVGDLMIISDHISFFTPNPLIGKNEETLGTRFPDMTEPYSRDLIASAKQIAGESGFKLHEGTYVAVTGPTFETKAEYRLIKTIGADAVGMSTVQEVIVARHGGMKVFAMSVITDLGIREEENVITHEEVLAAAKEAEPKLTTIFVKLIERL
jgi:purine-nucleoside phosphorylase